MGLSQNRKSMMEKQVLIINCEFSMINCLPVNLFSLSAEQLLMNN